MATGTGEYAHISSEMLVQWLRAAENEVRSLNAQGLHQMAMAAAQVAASLAAELDRRRYSK